MDHHGTDGSSRRSLLNGFVSAATRSWRHGLQPNGGHTSNAMVFPTITTAVNTSPTSRSPITDNANMTEEQHMRLQQQWNQDHRRNVLWYGGDDTNQHQQQSPAILFESHNRYQSTDDWEKQPLRQRRKKFRKTRRSHNKKHVLPTVPFVWASVLLAMYATAMAAVYFIYDANTGSGWIWFRGIASNNAGPLWWLNQIPPTWYYLSLAICAIIVGCFWHKWQQQQRWCCYILLTLFSSALLPSVPLAEVFGSKAETIMKNFPLENSTLRHQQPFIFLRHINDSQLTLYEGLWQVAFFVFVAYCMVLSTRADRQTDNKNDENINYNQNDDTKIDENISKEDHHVSIAVLVFAIISSIGHIALNMCTAYRWCFQQHHRISNSNSYMAAIQQLIANIVVLTCINLSGWLLRQSIVQDHAEIRGDEGDSSIDGKHKRLRLALQRQAYKLNRLLTSLLPRRVFLEMKYDIVADAARSYNLSCDFNNSDQQKKLSSQQHQQDLQLQTPQLPRMYLKEYENVSVVFANTTGFWDNTSSAVCHGEAGYNQSLNMITLVDRLLADLFRRVARRNHCIPVHLLGHRVYFVAGLPSEEGYELDDDERKSPKYVINNDEHAKNAIQMGLDLIDAIKTVVFDVSQLCRGRKINLNVQVGVHSGRIACGVLGFSGGTGISSVSGSRWQYGAWGHDVHVASFIEASGRPGLVHVSRATVEEITKKIVTIPGSNPQETVNFQNNIFNSSFLGFGSNDNKHDYTFERSHEDQRNQFLSQNQIDTYFVVPKTKCPSSESEIYGGPTKNEKNYVEIQDDLCHKNCFIEGIELLISQSIEILLQREEPQRQRIIDPTPETDMVPEQIPPTTTTTAVVDFPVTAAASLPAAPTTAVKIIMNRHRRSKYFEQDPLQAVSTKLNTSSAIKSVMDFHSRWEVDVFGGYDNVINNKFSGKSNDDDLFRLAKSHLLLLFVIISLFVVNVTTMPWTILLGMTFITPFVITAGELIYVMALLIGWIPRPRFHSSIYAAATIEDDDEYYHHYDSDNNDSDSSCSSDGGCKMFARLFVCHHSSSLISCIFKPFRRKTRNVMTTHSQQLDDNNGQWWCMTKWCRCCRCNGQHNWFTFCLDNDEVSSCMSSDDSDIESRLGFRNENAVMVAATGVSPPQNQLHNRLQKPQPINNSHIRNHKRRQRKRLTRKYQDVKRCTWFFWLSAASEVVVVLLVCLLALLNAFTCEPVPTTAIINSIYDQTNINNDSGGFNKPIVNTTLQQHHSPLTCLWPQYAVLTCCLVYVSIAISFPIYYGSLPTLRIKLGILFVTTFVFAIAFVHFTHRHVFIAASVSSLPSSYCSQQDNIINHQAINMTMHQDHNEENQHLLKLLDREQQCAAGLNTTTATIYAIAFATATLISFAYKYHLQNRQAHNRVKTDRDMRRLGVLCTAHRRTLRAILPDHVANSLRKSCGGDINEVDVECKEMGQRQNYVTTNTRPIPLTIIQGHGQNQIPAFMLPPLYHCGYQNIVIISATIVQQNLPLLTTHVDGSHNSQYSISHLTSLHDIISEFDQLLDIHKFQGIVEKIKLVGTNTYMAAVGLQYQNRTERQMMIELKDMEQRYNKSYQNNTEIDDDNVISNGRADIINNIQNGYQLCDVIAAHYVTFALDFICDMRRVLHRQRSLTLSSVGKSHYSHTTQFTLRVGVNVGPAVAGLIGCNDEVWKRPQFDIWGNSVNMARQMDVTSVPGRTQVTNCVHESMKSLKNPKYEFDIRAKTMNKDLKKAAYFVREKFKPDESHHSALRILSSDHQAHQQQNYHHHHNESNHRQESRLYPITPVRPCQNTQQISTNQSERDQSLNAVPVVNVHAQQSYYRVHQELRNKCSEYQKTPPLPPPPCSPLPANSRRTQHSHYQVMRQQYSGERDRQSDQQQQSLGNQLSRDKNQTSYQQKRNVTGSVVTYSRPLQKHQKNSQHSTQPGSAPVPRGLVRMFGDNSQQSVPVTNITATTNINTVTNAKPTYTSNSTSGARRPTVLPLKNTAMAALLTKNFDADRPLPAPPRSSDTVAGRQRHHNDPRKRRRQLLNQPPSMAVQQQHFVRSGMKDDRCPVAWPSSFRSPISVGSLVSASSPPSSLSSSDGSTDAGGTTTSNNNYNTTTNTSSSDESFGRTGTEDGGGIDRAYTEGFDTAFSSVAVSPINQRYRQHQQQHQHLLLRQWSPSTTANSSPVRRSASFRSPLSGGEITAASSSSLKSPPMGGPNSNACGGTQSLNRRRIRTTNSNAGGGNSSSRRRRRRQQQDIESTREQSTSPTNIVVTDVLGVIANPMATAEKYGSPTTPWKKQQRRQLASKDQGIGNVTAGPDFTDEIRRILLLDHHRGNVRQQHQQFEEKEIQTKKHCDEFNNSVEEVNTDIVTQPSSSTVSDKRQHRAATAGQKLHEENLNNPQNENNGNVNNTELDAKSVVEAVDTSTSSFEAREREITEQVKRQQAEVRRILQEHKNNVVAVVKGVAAVTADVTSHSHRRVVATAVEWSDDESIEPSSLPCDSHRQQCTRFPETTNRRLAADNEYTTGPEGDEYTTDGDGDGYTTTGGYTTDDAAATSGVAYSVDLPITFGARHLDDNLSTMNDTGLTDAEAALSDVNSMIDYNDCNDNNQYRGRRQSSLSSNSVCPYASDSFCEDDDDYNDDEELLFWDGYRPENEKLDLCDYNVVNDGSNSINLFHQQQLLLPQSSPVRPSNDVAIDNNNKKLYQQQQQHSQTSKSQTLPEDSANYTTITSDNTVAEPTSTVKISANTTSITSDLSRHGSLNSTIDVNSTGTSTELDEPKPSSTVINDNLNIS